MLRRPFLVIPKIGVVYRKIHTVYRKYSDTQNIAVIILKFEQCGSTIEFVQKMQTEWQTVLTLS